jgi:hypothetical protein
LVVYYSWHFVISRWFQRLTNSSSETNILYPPPLRLRPKDVQGTTHLPVECSGLYFGVFKSNAIKYIIIIMLPSSSLSKVKQFTNGQAVLQNSLKLAIRCCSPIDYVPAVNRPLRDEQRQLAQVVITMDFSQRRTFARSRGKVGKNQKSIIKMTSSMNADIASTPMEEKDEEAEEKKKKKKKLSQWGIIKEVWRQYLWTWKGFFTARDKLPPDHLIYRTKEEEEEMREKQADGVIEDTDGTKNTVREILLNLRSNISQLRSEGPKAYEQISDLAKKEELKIWVGDQMRLAADCITHFLQGYREGRDAEIQNVLSDKYFTKNDDDGEIRTVDEKPIERKGGRRRLRRRHLN